MYNLHAVLVTVDGDNSSASGSDRGPGAAAVAATALVRPGATVELSVELSTERFGVGDGVSHGGGSATDNLPAYMYPWEVMRPDAWCVWFRDGVALPTSRPPPMERLGSNAELEAVVLQPDLLQGSPPDALYEPRLVLPAVGATEAGVYHCVLRTAGGACCSMRVTLELMNEEATVTAAAVTGAGSEEPLAVGAEVQAAIEEEHTRAALDAEIAAKMEEHAKLEEELTALKSSRAALE